MQFLVCLSLSLAGISAAFPAEEYSTERYQGKEVRVKSGRSIQDAINAAKPGTQITVEKGIYKEQISISTNGISLIGKDATLTPPTGTPTQNTCTGLAGDGTNAGICITSKDVVLETTFRQEHRDVVSAGKRVKDVFVTGFTIKDFSGEGIAILNAEDTRVKDNKLINNGGYGVLSHYSHESKVVDNKVTSETLRFIGICTDDMSPSKVKRNNVSGYGIGLCVQTNGAEYIENNIKNACAAIFVDPGISAKVVNNNIGANNPGCLEPGSFGFVTGIIVFGATNSVIRFNTIRNQRANGQAAGISVVDAFQISPSLVSSGNIVTKNVLENNDFDIFVNTTGAGNVVRPNTCTTPADLCSR